MRGGVGVGAAGRGSGPLLDDDVALVRMTDPGQITAAELGSSEDVKVGDDVVAGQQIARVGNSGPSTGCHLDVRINVIGNTNSIVADLPRAETIGGPVGFVNPEEFYEAFGLELCGDTCRRTY